MEAAQLKIGLTPENPGVFAINSKGIELEAGKSCQLMVFFKENGESKGEPIAGISFEGDTTTPGQPDLSVVKGFIDGFFNYAKRNIKHKNKEIKQKQLAAAPGGTGNLPATRSGNLPSTAHDNQIEKAVIPVDRHFVESWLLKTESDLLETFEDFRRQYNSEGVPAMVITVIDGRITLALEFRNTKAFKNKAGKVIREMVTTSAFVLAKGLDEVLKILESQLDIKFQKN